MPAPQGKGKGAPAAAPAAAPAVSQHTNLTSWTFGKLHELLEINQGKLTLIGFPALVGAKSAMDDAIARQDSNVNGGQKSQRWGGLKGQRPEK